jgi:membrane fusion protein, copper/silver efflux system
MMNRWGRTRRVGAELVAAALAVSLSGCGWGRAQKKAPQAESAPSPAATKQHKVLYWKSSMVPGYRSDKPGIDPMGMKLVPVYAGEEAAGPPGSVTLSPETVQQIGVKTTIVRREVMRRDVRTIGRIDYDEELVRDVAPKIGGWVEQQYVNFPGQMVHKGEALGSVYSPELVATEQEYLNALQYQGRLKESPLEDATVGAQSLVKTVEIRLRYWDITDAQIRALRERGRITRTMVLHAPFTGIVVKKNVFQGGYVKPGQSMYRLADISKVWIYADIYEYEAPWVRLGQDATMALSYEPGVTYHGRVIYVYPYLKQRTRTLEVRMEFRNGPHFELKPGMWANVNLRPDVTRKALVVPVEAVIQTGKKNFVILALGDGHFMARRIELGAQAGNDFEVLSGLEAGDRIVDSAEFLINSESALQSAFNKMTWKPPTAPGTPAASGAKGTTAPMPGMPGMEKSQSQSPSGHEGRHGD